MLLLAISLSAVVTTIVTAVPNPATQEDRRPACRYLPSDTEWPAKEEWDRLNATVGGQLILGAIGAGLP